MANIFVTGGSGFIGTHLVETLAARGDRVTSIDLVPPENAAHRAMWREADLLDRAAIGKLLAALQPRTIYNLAAETGLVASEEALTVNTQGLENLLTATADWVEKPRIVHTSTQMVTAPGYTPSGLRDYAPDTSYGQSKAGSEEVLRNWPGDIEWTIVRPTLVWGPLHQHLAASTWYYLLKRWYLVPSRNPAMKTYSYVGNLVEQLVAAGDAEAATVNRKTFYGGDDVLDSAAWLDAFARALTGRPARRFPYPLLRLLAWGGDVSMRLGGPSPINSARLFRMTENYPVSLDDSHRALGKGSTSLEQGVEATVAWLRRADPGRFPPGQP